ncbi:MAG: PIN domain-containing protein [Propionibacteriaceae bacterium]|nr:PIN domain-containing protein [Propionibacteriaceae bacterium]
MHRRIIVDANILIRAVLGVRARELIVRHGADVSFFTPEVAFLDAARYLPVIAMKRGADPVPLISSLDRLRSVVEVVPDDVTGVWKSIALERIGGRDPMDWPFVAAALALDCPIWTEDNDFFGSGVPTWTSDRVDIYLRGD